MFRISFILILVLLQSFSLALDHPIFKGKKFTALIEMEVLRPNKVLKYLYKVYVNEDRTLVRFIKPSKRLYVLKVKTKYWLYFPNTKRLIVTSGEAAMGESDFKYSDIMDIELFNNYEVKEKGKNYTLLKRKSKKHYPFIKIIYDSRGTVQKIEFLSAELKVIKEMIVLERDENGNVKKVLMKLGFTEDYKTYLEVLKYEKEEVPKWKLSPQYLKNY